MLWYNTNRYKGLFNVFALWGFGWCGEGGCFARGLLMYGDGVGYDIVFDYAGEFNDCITVYFNIICHCLS